MVDVIGGFLMVPLMKPSLFFMPLQGSELLVGVIDPNQK